MHFTLKKNSFFLLCLIVFFGCACFSYSAEGTDSRQATIAIKLNSAVDRQNWMGGSVCAMVQDAHLPITLFSQSPDVPFIAAQLTQLFTTQAALEQLGPDFRFSTQLGWAGPVQEDTLKGCLILTGNGDPSLSLVYQPNEKLLWETFDQWAQALRKMGIAQIEEGIRLETSALDDKLCGPGWNPQMWGQPDYPSVGALNFNHNLMQLFIKAGRKKSSPIKISTWPAVPGYTYISNQLQIVPEPLRPFEFQRIEHGNVVALHGELSPRQKVQATVAIQDPARFFVEVLKERFAKNDVQVQGAIELNTTSLPDMHLVDTRLSPPLSDLLRKMLCEDQALEAEVIFKSMGRRLTKAKEPGSFQNGAKAMEKFLSDHQFAGLAPVLVDGSGRSTLNRVTARQIIELLKIMQNAEAHSICEQLLPRPGQSGVFEHRLNNLDRNVSAVVLPAALGGVNALAGWFDTANGHRFLFVFAVQNSRCPAQVQAHQLDAVLQELLNGWKEL